MSTNDNKKDILLSALLGADAVVTSVAGAKLFKKLATKAATNGLDLTKVKKAGAGVGMGICSGILLAGDFIPTLAQAIDRAWKQKETAEDAVEEVVEETVEEAVEEAVEEVPEEEVSLDNAEESIDDKLSEDEAPEEAVEVAVEEEASEENEESDNMTLLKENDIYIKIRRKPRE